MSFLRSFVPREPDVPGDSTEPLPDVRGPLTSRQAATWVEPVVRAVAGDAVLELVQSGPSLLHDGRSLVWEFLLRFPSRTATAIFTVEPIDLEADPDAPLMQLRRRFRKAGDDGRSRPPGLSWSFHDSPAVVDALTRRGADFVSGPTDMGLTSSVDMDGTLTWTTDTFNGRLGVADADV